MEFQSRSSLILVLILNSMTVSAAAETTADSAVNKDINETLVQKQLEQRGAEDRFSKVDDGSVSPRPNSPEISIERLSQISPGQSGEHDFDSDERARGYYDSSNDSEKLVQQILAEDQKKQKNKDAYFKALQKEYERMANAAGVRPEPNLAKRLKELDQQKSKN